MVPFRTYESFVVLVKNITATETRRVAFRSVIF